MPRRRTRTASVGLLCAGVLAAGCSEDPEPRRLPTTPPAAATRTDSATATGSATMTGAAATDTEGSTATTMATGTTATQPPTEPPTMGDPQVEAGDFDVPWGLVVLDDGTVLVGERDTGQVYRMAPGEEPAAWVTVPGVKAGGEGGLLGLAVPDSGAGGNSFYAYLTTAEDNRVVRVDASASTPDGSPATTVLVEGIPKAGNHNGGRIAFGPDGYLYVSTGDASEGELAQDPASLGGKVLRVDEQGQPAPDNPDPGSPVLSMGHRNVQGLAWDDQGRLWASEFGQNAFDELNLIEPGGNYGWPHVEGAGGEPQFIDPAVTWPTSEASPSGLALGPDGALYLAALRGQSLWRIPLQESGATGEPERLLAGEYGRLRSVVESDGALWVLTSNTFRGDPHPDDDRLLHIPFSR